MITNVLQYGKDDKAGTRISFLLVGKDRFSNTDKFRGYTPVESYIKGHEAFISIPIELIGKPIDATFKQMQDYNNPLNVRNILESLEFNGAIISLL